MPHFVCLCVGEIISLPWFSKELKNNCLCGIILILLVRESIFVGWGSPFLIVLVLRYKLSLCHTPIKPDLLGFSGIGVFACWLHDHVITRFASFCNSCCPLVSLYMMKTPKIFYQNILVMLGLIIQTRLSSWCQLMLWKN